MISKKQDLLFASKQLCTVFIAARQHPMSQNSASAYTYPWSYHPRYSFAIRCIERCMYVKSEILDHANVQTTLQTASGFDTLMKWYFTDYTGSAASTFFMVLAVAAYSSK